MPIHAALRLAFDGQRVGLRPTSTATRTLCA